MAHTDFPYLYPYSAEEARRRDELDQWRQSHRMNIACKEAIEAAISRDFDGMHLEAGCAKSVIATYGYKRTGFLLASTLQEFSHDGRFSQSNKAWGQQIYIPPDKNHNYQYTVGSHPAVLDGFIQEFREAYAELGLFEPKHCEPDTTELDYEGKVLVMRPEVFQEGYWEPKYQLWYAHDGFGCDPHAIGRSIRCTCLGDGEQTRWNRTDFIGPIKEEFLPDWAREQAEQLRAGQQIEEITASFGNEQERVSDKGPQIIL